MKTDAIKADGTIYWYERGNSWGRYLHAGYDKGRVKRVDDKRYDQISTFRPTYREDSKGKYILVERLEEGYEGKTMYVLPVQIRDEYEAVKQRYEAAQIDQQARTITHAAQLEAANDRADALRERLANLGLDRVIHVRVAGQSTWQGETPRIKAELIQGSEDELTKLLDLINEQL